MRKLLALAALLLSAHSFGAESASTTIDIKRFLGTYEGKVQNGAGLESVVTVFKSSREGALTGSYTVTNPERTFKGTISSIMFEGPRTISMEWTDKDGEGQATMEFSSDYQSFVGEWIGNRGGRGEWNGRKTGP